MNKDQENIQDDNIKNNQQEYDQDGPAEEFIDDGLEYMAEEEDQEEKKEDTREELDETEQLKNDLGKEKDKFLRLFAEFENYKRRTSKERLELFKTANQEVMTALLPVMDDFDRALNEIRKAKDKNLVKGVELIHNKFKETLRSKGLEAMEVKEGDTFDADVHEAITQIPAPNEKLKGKIVDVVERGYKLGERIVRFPKVVTGK
ncbi:MAG TPA: nucleotide exchange factor GrpE [Gillisia sp.]|nr:nucleotide exchange factor GrpE [Gillisia sp.]